MNTFKIIPALALLTLSLNAKPNINETNTNVKTVRNQIECPVELLTEKNTAAVRVFFKVNENGKAENIVINAENEKIKQYVTDKLAKLDFPQKNEDVNLVIHFKLI